MSPDNLEALSEAVQPAKQVLKDNLVKLQASGKIHDDYLRSALQELLERIGDNSAQLKTSISRDIVHSAIDRNCSLPAEIPTLKIGICGDRSKREMGIVLWLPEDEELVEAIFGNLTAADYRTLCEYGVLDVVAAYEEFYEEGSGEKQDLRESPDVLIDIGGLEAGEMLTFVQQQNPEVDFRKIIKPGTIKRK